MKNLLLPLHGHHKRSGVRAGFVARGCLPWALVGFLLVSPFAHCLQQTSSGAEPPIVYLAGGRLSVDARNASWDEIVKVIGEKTGIRFHSWIALDQRVTIAFKDLPADAALRQILGADTNIFLRYPDKVSATTPGAVPAEVWILGRGQDSGDAAINAADTSENRPAQALTSGEEGPLPEDVKPLNNGQFKELMDKLRTGNAEERAQAILRLSEDEKGRSVDVRKALDAAMSDTDPQVRALAMQTLASQGEPEASAEYVRQGLHDPDPGVRLAALAVLPPGTPDGHLVREALNDPDEAVRAQAAELMTILGLAPQSAP